MRFHWAAVALACVWLAGCHHQAGDEGDAMTFMATKAGEARAQASNPNQYMAYERAIELDVDVGQIADILHAAETACRQATADRCVILESNLESGRDASANLRVRAAPAGIQKVMASVASGGARRASSS